ncbi:hypothetical protein V6N13_079114 [Hibiscus sabdariffa]
MSVHLKQLTPVRIGRRIVFVLILPEDGISLYSVMTRKMMRNKGDQKMPGWSSVRVSNKTHEFIARDTSHPQRNFVQHERADKNRPLYSGEQIQWNSMSFFICYRRI